MLKQSETRKITLKQKTRYFFLYVRSLKKDLESRDLMRQAKGKKRNVGENRGKTESGWFRQYYESEKKKTRISMGVT